MRKIFNLFWFFTFVLFFAALTLSYAYLPENIGIHADNTGAVDQFIKKEAFFYIGLIIFVVSNIVSFYFIRVLDSVPASTSFYFKNQSFKYKITNWFAGFVTMVNLFLVMAVSYIAIFNSQDYQIEKYNYLLYLIPVLFVVSMAWLAFIFTRRHHQLELE